MRRIIEPYPIGVIRASMSRSDFSSSCGSEKLYGNALINPPNGLGRCGEFVSVITSCWSASSRWAMYLPEKPNAPVTAIRTPASHQADRTSFAREDYAPCGTSIQCQRHCGRGPVCLRFALATFGHRFDFVVACWQEENSMI